MLDGIELKPLSDLPEDFEIVRRGASEEGFGFLDRLARDWLTGDNRFDRAGELLVGAFAQGELIAIGGINRDPYAEQANIGRLRHLYVLKDWRFTGVGRALVDRLLGHAGGVFSEVRLRTGTKEASAFYLRCGFSAAGVQSASHVRMI